MCTFIITIITIVIITIIICSKIFIASTKFVIYIITFIIIIISYLLIYVSFHCIKKKYISKLFSCLIFISYIAISRSCFIGVTIWSLFIRYGLTKIKLFTFHLVILVSCIISHNFNKPFFCFDKKKMISI